MIEPCASSILLKKEVDATLLKKREFAGEEVVNLVLIDILVIYGKTKFYSNNTKWWNTLRLRKKSKFLK